MKQRASHSPRNRSGMALMLVIPAVALATILAYAVLANTGVQQQIGANAVSIAQADSLAESGMNYAMYNLQYPSNAPVYSGSFWAGPSGNISPDASVPGSFSVSVAQSGSNFIITSTGTVTGTNISRTITSVVKPTYQAVQPNQAAGIAGNVSANNLTVTGDLRAAGSVTLNSGSSVSGNVYATSLILNGGTDSSSFVQMPSSGVTVAPTTVTDFRTYQMNGVTYNGKLLSSSPAAGTVLGPTATNPAGVYYAQGMNLNLNGVTINGTLIIKKTGTSGGNVVIKGVNTITPASGFPGLVVDSQIQMSGTGRSLTVNGLTWAAGGLTGSAGNSMTVNGALLIPNSTGIGGYSGALALNYNAQNVAVPNFSTQMQVPINIAVVSWSEQ